VVVRSADQVFGALSVSGAAGELTPEREDEVAQRLVMVAEQMVK
jgi:DNA-binding IclR family transcriptional regulator